MTMAKKKKKCFSGCTWKKNVDCHDADKSIFPLHNENIRNNTLNLTYITRVRRYRVYIII